MLARDRLGGGVGRDLRASRVKGVRGLRRMAEELRRGQENVLPHDLLRNNRAVDDVFWNGPDRRSRVQRVGAFLMGFTLFSVGFVCACEFYQEGARVGLVPFIVIVAWGGRIIWMSVRGRRVG